MRNSKSLVVVFIVVLGVWILAPGRLMASPINYPGICTSGSVPNPGGTFVVTNSCSQTQVLQTSTATASVSAYQTTITAELGSGAYLFNASFNRPYLDALVQAAVLQAENALLSAGAGGYSGPTLVSSAQTSSSSVSTTTSAPVDSGNGFYGSTITFGPGPILVGNLGLCQGLVSAPFGPIPTGCTGQGIAFFVLAGQTDQNVNGDEVFDVNQVTTTTDTTLTSQTYNLNGAGNVAATPEPGSIYLLGTGLLGLVGVAKRRLPRRRHRGDRAEGDRA